MRFILSFLFPLSVICSAQKLYATNVRSPILKCDVVEAMVDRSTDYSFVREFVLKEISNYLLKDVVDLRLQNGPQPFQFFYEYKLADGVWTKLPNFEANVIRRHGGVNQPSSFNGKEIPDRTSKIEIEISRTISDEKLKGKKLGTLFILDALALHKDADSVMFALTKDNFAAIASKLYGITLDEVKAGMQRPSSEKFFINLRDTFIKNHPDEVERNNIVIDAFWLVSPAGRALSRTQWKKIVYIELGSAGLSVVVDK